MRHAKAEVAAASDHERRLTARGVRDAAEVGRWASSQGVLPDHAFVSAAARAQETWAAFSASAGLDLVPELDESLYSAGSEAAIEVLRSAPEDAGTVMIVGHNPTMAQLVHLLDDGSGDPTAMTAASGDFPTSALAVLDVPGEWRDLGIATARIAALHVGRD
jgi:phosphohistidine phosphatase